MNPRDKKPTDSVGPLCAATTSAVPAMSSDVVARAVTDPATLAQGRAFAEAVRQTTPLAPARSREAAQAARFLQDTTARPTGLTSATAQLQATRAGEMQQLIAGPNPGGKAKEIIAALDYRDLHAGRDPGMVNAPEHLAPNLADVRLAPDAACRRDIVFQVRTDDGMLLTVPGGQVKTGSAQYLTDSLVDMASTPGYGRTGYVDARYVNADGTPRVAADGFTPGQARKLQGAKVKLRGIRDLDARGDALRQDISAARCDGLDPVARRRLAQLRDDIAQAYGARGVAARVASAAAVAAATAAVVALVVQYATTGKVDVEALRDATVQSTVLAGAGGLADAGLYHAATHAGMAPEAARAFAAEWVAAGFCLLAVGADAFAEISAVHSGQATVADAVAGGAFKAALDVLPLVLAPLGLPAIPVVIGAQLGGRWVLARVRASDRQLEQGLAEARAAVADLDARLATARAQSDECDQIYARAMASAGAPHLQVVK